MSAKIKGEIRSHIGKVSQEIESGNQVYRKSDLGVWRDDIKVLRDFLLLNFIQMQNRLSTVQTLSPVQRI